LLEFVEFKLGDLPQKIEVDCNGQAIEQKVLTIRNPLNANTLCSDVTCPTDIKL